MVVLKIAFKYVKTFMRSFILIPMLVGLPIFQIFIMRRVSGSLAEQTAAVPSSGAVDLILLSSPQNVSFVSLIAASTLVQFLLITGTVAASMFISEREENTLMRVLAAPVGKWSVILGNLLGQCLVILLVAAAIMLISGVFFGIEWGNSYFNLLVVTLLILFVSTSLGFALSGVFKKANLATGVMTFIILIMTFLSGGFTLDDSFDKASYFTINKWAFTAYNGLQEGKSLGDIKGNLTVMALLGTVLLVSAILLYRRENIYE